jgi:hypothetical protein
MTGSIDWVGHVAIDHENVSTRQILIRRLRNHSRFLTTSSCSADVISTKFFSVKDCFLRFMISRRKSVAHLQGSREVRLDFVASLFAFRPSTGPRFSKIVIENACAPSFRLMVAGILRMPSAVFARNWRIGYGTWNVPTTFVGVQPSGCTEDRLKPELQRCAPSLPLSPRAIRPKLLI